MIRMLAFFESSDHNYQYIILIYLMNNYFLSCTIYMLFREQSRKNEHFSKEVFAKELKKLVALEETRPRKERCWRFPPLEECRNHFEEKYGIKITEPG